MTDMESYSTFVTNAKKHIVQQLSMCTFGGYYGNKKLPHILASKDDVYELLLCKDIRSKEVCKYLFGGTLKFQKCAHHVNSSQILCMNLFGPLMVRKDNNQALSQLINGFGISLSGNIDRAQFEYKPSENRDRTNFDFYVHSDVGEEVYFEIKYTEQAFGHPSPGSFKSEEVQFYDRLCRESLYLTNFCGRIKQKFLDGNFQVWRNIAHVKKNGLQYSVFLIPSRNTALHFPIEFCKSMSNHVKLIHLENIAPIAERVFSQQHALIDYYQKFQHHYFGF